MFKPRWLMTPRQREQLDAQYADLLELRRELATMNATQKSLRARELCGGAMELRRHLQLDGGGLAACVLATAVTLVVATASINAVAITHATRPPPSSWRWRRSSIAPPQSSRARRLFWVAFMVASSRRSSSRSAYWASSCSRWRGVISHRGLNMVGS